jgi:hypothetical protein
MNNVSPGKNPSVFSTIIVGIASFETAYLHLQRALKMCHIQVFDEQLAMLT